MLHRTLLGVTLLGLVGLPYVLSTQKDQPRAPDAALAEVAGMAASLTYYFGGDQQLQRIVFHGTTGEPRSLVQFVSQKFDFKSDSASDAGTQRYVVRWSGKIVSELRVQPAQIIDAGQPHRRFS